MYNEQAGAHMTGLLEEAELAVSLPGPPRRREIRRNAHVGRPRLVAELGVHPVTVARWEQGTRDPRGTTRVAYARLLRGLASVTVKGGPA
jgi:DNA-binding transcriptional regulator YiaG